jgi:hypothetical protein
VRFAVVGDSGGLPWWVNVVRMPPIHWLARAGTLPLAGAVKRIGEQLAAARPDFWLHVGDVIYPRGEHRHFGPGFFDPFAAALRRAPVYAVLGNHDWEWDRGRPFLQNFELPDDADEQFFSFGWGPLRVVGLNLCHSVGVEPGVAYLERALEHADEPWRVVVEHYPPWSASRQGDRPDLIERLVPELRRHRVDLLLCGNDHAYQRFSADGWWPPVAAARVCTRCTSILGWCTGHRCITSAWSSATRRSCCCGPSTSTARCSTNCGWGSRRRTAQPGSG